MPYFTQVRMRAIWVAGTISLGASSLVAASTSSARESGTGRSVGSSFTSGFFANSASAAWRRLSPALADRQGAELGGQKKRRLFEPQASRQQ